MHPRPIAMSDTGGGGQKMNNSRHNHREKIKANMRMRNLAHHNVQARGKRF